MLKLITIHRIEMADKTPLIIIDGYIGEGEKVDADAIMAAINKLKADGIKKAMVRINSGGGDMMQGFAIYDAMQESGIEFTAHVIGLCGSMATVIMMACKTIKMSANAMLMFHQAKAGLHGTADELRNMADLTEKLESKSLAIYIARTGLEEGVIKGWLSDGKDTWMTAQEALANKVIDEIVEPVKVFKPASMATEREAWNRVYSKAFTNTTINMDKEMLKIVGLPEDATQEQYDAKVKELATARKKAEDDLAAEREAKATSLVENAVKAGKIKAEAKAGMLVLAKSDYTAAQTVIDSFETRKLPSDYVGMGGNKENNPEDRSNWSFTDWSKKDSKGLLKMKAEQPEEYQKLFAATGVKITENNS